MIITYFHIDDDVWLCENVSEFLKNQKSHRFSFESLGFSQSSNDSISKLKKLFTQDSTPDLIFLDQHFFIDDQDKNITKKASVDFIQQLKLWLDGDKTVRKIFLKKTKIIIFSATATTVWMEYLKKNLHPYGKIICALALKNPYDYSSLMEAISSSLIDKNADS